MEAKARTHLTEDKYLALEAQADEKHEFLNGEMIALSARGKASGPAGGGSSPAHNAICMNIGSELRSLIKASGRPRRVMSSGQRVRIDHTGLYAYPDITVVCGPALTAAESPNTLTNPLLLVEVLSGETEAYDRGEKFAHYRRLPSLQSYLLVAQNTRQIEHFQRLPSDQWLLTVIEEGELPIPCLEGALSVDEVYWNVDLATEAE